MSYSSRPVDSNQDGVHRQLPRLIRRHLSQSYRKPYAKHTLAAFQQARSWLGGDTTPLLLDSGCGTGMSTLLLARRFPRARVIGIDKSCHRLRRGQRCPKPGNALLLRADIGDFWRLAVTEGWQLQQHYLLYPNPWPKAKHVMRRWHGSPLLPYLLALAGRVEVRSNWRLYIDEFAAALGLLGYGVVITTPGR